MKNTPNTQARQQNKKLAIVTALTIARAPITLAGAAMALYHASAPSIPALVATISLLSFSGITDLLDGALARRWEVTSRFGALADPFMDKVFFVVTLPVALYLAMQAGDVIHAGMLLTLLIISMVRDLWLSFMRSVAAPYGAEMAATIWGKLRTFLAFPIIIVIFLMLGLENLDVHFTGLWRFGVLSLETILLLITIISAITYTVFYMPSLKRAVSETAHIQ